MCCNNIFIVSSFVIMYFITMCALTVSRDFRTSRIFFFKQFPCFPIFIISPLNYFKFISLAVFLDVLDMFLPVGILPCPALFVCDFFVVIIPSLPVLFGASLAVICYPPGYRTDIKFRLPFGCITFRTIRHLSFTSFCTCQKFCSCNFL